MTFTSNRSEVRPDATYVFPDVYLHDRQTVTTTRLSSGASDQTARDPVISANGRFIAYFNSAAQEGWVTRLYLHDRTTGQSAPVPNVFPESTYLDITADGGSIAFVQQLAPDLPWDVYVHNRQTGQSRKVSVASNGFSGSGGGAVAPAISANGLLVAFYPGTRTSSPATPTDKTTSSSAILLRSLATPDADGLPDTWELQFGLDRDDGRRPATAPAAIPTATALTNPQEIGGGTHPRGFFTRYLAEGAAGDFFDRACARSTRHDAGARAAALPAGRGAPVSQS